MNHFGWLAEELTQMEETLDAPAYRPYAKKLQRALQRTFVEACKASRAMREEVEAQKSAPPISGRNDRRQIVRRPPGGIERRKPAHA